MEGPDVISIGEASPLKGAAMTLPSTEYRLIPLTQGQFAKVSSHRFDHLMQWKWQARFAKCTKSFYAIRGDRADGRSVTMYMHRYILGLERGDKRHCDHIDGDTLHNVDENLRIAWQGDNKKNAKKRRDNTSGYKGVCWMKSANAWCAQIQCNRKHIHLGRFATPELAYAAYCAAAAELHGEFARMA